MSKYFKLVPDEDSGYGTLRGLLLFFQVDSLLGYNVAKFAQ